MNTEVKQALIGIWKGKGKQGKSRTDEQNQSTLYACVELS
jgi:hypothetical protein